MQRVAAAENCGWPIVRVDMQERAGAFQRIIGQTRFIPIFTTVVGNGNNAVYDIVAFVGVRILDVNLTGSMSSKHLTVQPALVYSRGALPNTTSTATTGYYLYSPVFLVK